MVGKTIREHPFRNGARPLHRVGGESSGVVDARVGDRVITPRIGKPVEVEALWLNALSAASYLEPSWRDAFDRGRVAFRQRFWNQDLGRLADVVDVDHVPGTRDDTLRPNQILAVGGLCRADRRATGAPPGRCRRAGVAHADWPAIAWPRRAWLFPAIRRRCVSARCGVSPGHGLAVADWPSHGRSLDRLVLADTSRALA